VTLRNLHGKEGVDGSSPSEGFAEMPANQAVELSQSPTAITREYSRATLQKMRLADVAGKLAELVAL
jgi:hypothetical protein